MSAAHLHAVPDPEPDNEEPGPGEWPAPVPAVAAPRTAGDDQLVSPVANEDADDEEPGKQRESWMPDLRPYCNVRPLAELGPLAVEASRVGGPRLLRALGHLFRAIGRLLKGIGQMLWWYGRGILALLILLTGWLTGSIGKHGSVGARLASAGFAAYAVTKTCLECPAAPWITLAVALTAAAMASMGHITVPGSKPAKKAPAKKGEGKNGDKKATGKETAAPAEEETKKAPEVAKEDAPAAPRRGLLGRLGGRHKSTPAAPSPGVPEEGDEEAGNEPPQEVAETTDEPPSAPSREDVIRALHHLYRGGSGVLNTALAQHLRLPHTQALRRVLTEAGITPRPGVRTPAGNGPGIHRSDFPVLPPAHGDPQGSGVCAGQRSQQQRQQQAAARGEGLAVYGNEWTREELAQGHRFVPDTDRGPSAWKIEYRAPRSRP